MSAQHDTPTQSPRPASGTAPESELQAPAPRRAHLGTRISGIRVALIAGVLVLAVVMIFVIQNANPVGISFLGAHLRVPLAGALVLAAIAGALVMAAAGTARITQLRQVMRRDRRKARAS
jgi:putative membrane protein